jgi:tripartite-type tricarboxylate transporter receptor subunit TctC
LLRRLFAGALLLLLVASTLASLGCSKPGPYPNQQIEFVVPFAPGGPVDTAARAIQPKMSALLGVPVVVVNKPGNGGAAAASSVAKAPADGYQVLATSSGVLTVLPAAGSKVDYSDGDFVSLGSFASDVAVLAVKTDNPRKTIEQLVDSAKKNPGKLTYGTPGHGTTAFLMMELLKKRFGVDLGEVPFDGAAPATDALLNGQVDVIATALSSVAAQVQAGAVRLLVQSGPDRVSKYSEVPTLAEKGLTPQSLSIWIGLYVPAATPREITERLAGGLATTMQDPGVFDAFDRIALGVDYRNPDAARKVLQNEALTLGRALQDIPSQRQN